MREILSRVAHHHTAAAVLALVAAAVASMSLPETASSQAGLEAAAIASHAVTWAEGHRSTGSSIADRFRVVFSAVPSTSPAFRHGRGSGLSGPPRVPRKPSGAPAHMIGIVLQEDTRQPVAGVSLVLTSTDPEYITERDTTRSDAAGRFVFESVEPGHWSLVLDLETLPPTFIATRSQLLVTTAKHDSIRLPAFELSRAACVEGRAVWSDGVTLADAPLLIAPRDTLLYSVGGLVDGIGDFSVCTAPPDSAMVWIDLLDGRRLGRQARLDVGKLVRVEFQPEPLNRMRGSSLSLEARTEKGLAVGFAEFVVVGSRRAEGSQPALVFSRQAVADRSGVAEFTLPPGHYEILAMNPREGEWGRVRDLEISIDSPAIMRYDITVTGKSTAAQRDAWRAGLLDRAEVLLFVWADL